MQVKAFDHHVLRNERDCGKTAQLCYYARVPEAIPSVPHGMQKHGPFPQELPDFDQVANLEKRLRSQVPNPITHHPIFPFYTSQLESFISQTDLFVMLHRNFMPSYFRHLLSKA